MPRITRRLGSSLLAACALTGAALAGTQVAHPAPGIVEDDYRLVLEDKPTNAGKVFRWGLAAWEDEFRPEVEFDNRRWQSNVEGRVGQQIGMLTLKAGTEPMTVQTTATDHFARYGRWEARVRTRVFDRGNAPYRVFFELVPVGEYRCGAKNLVIGSYQPGRPMVEGYIRTRPNNEFHYQVDPEATTEEFHTFAIEVAPDHITWFVDKKVIMTERRPEALSGVRYRVRFRMEGTSDPRETMNESWLQMDWVRYYTLERPNALPIIAPPAERTTYAGGCWPAS